MVRYYVDTAIFRDYYEDRRDRFRPLGEWALMFFKMVEETSGEILVSDTTLAELQVDYTDEEIRKVLGVCTRVLVTKTSKRITQETEIIKRERKVPKGDAIHALIAKRENALMVTRDKHFNEMIDIVDYRKPEDLL